MPRAKKTRKSGLIGTPKVNPSNKRSSTGNSNPPKMKRKKGNSPGSRHNVESNKKPESTKTTTTDKRVGSKKPIPLIVEPKKSNKPVKAKKYRTPLEELDALESDARFNRLLDQIEDNVTLTTDDQKWIDEKLERHKILCDLLGIKLEEDDVEDSDPFDALDAIQMDDFKD